jgi:PAS domain S-box-containing protein
MSSERFVKRSDGSNGGTAAAHSAVAKDGPLPRDFRSYNTIPGMLSVVDEDGRFIAVSDHWLEKMGYARDDVIGTPRSKYFSPQWHAYFRARVLPVIDAEGCVDGVELELVRKDGSPLSVLISSRVEIDPDSRRRYYVTLCVDLNERKRSEEELRGSEARFRALFECSSDVVLVVDAAGVVRIASPSILDVMGYQTADAVGRSVFDLVHPEDVAGVRAAFASLGGRPGAIERGEARARASDGHWRSFAWSARNAMTVPGIEGLLVSARDLTEFRRLESQLNDARRLQAIGALAGGIAHDINNVLGAILGFAKLLHEDLNEASTQRTYADRIVSASERGRDLIHQVFTFSRAGRVERQPEDVAALAEETVQALPALLPPEVRLSVQIEHKPLVARVNAAQIQQLLLNLVLNSRDALVAGSGAIAVDVGEIGTDSEDYRQLRFYEGNGIHADHTLGGHEIVLGALDAAPCYVRILVSDTGKGMERDTLVNAFEPFFTTKSRATGTGLGLATVRSIAAAAGGACVMRSAPGRGTTVSVWLPLMDIEAKPAPVQPTAAPARRGRGRVIVVDDEQDLADATAIGLRRLGYEAVAFNDPKEALQRFTASPEDWRSVISDHRMPGMTGLQLLEAMKAARPAVDFILCSGFTDGTIEGAAFERGASHFFLKPVDVASLAKAIEANPQHVLA